MGKILITELQKADLGTFGFGRHMDEEGKYLDFKTSCGKLLGWSVILHAAISMRPMLIACRFLIPKPPSFFGEHISFQAFKHKLLALVSSLTPVHQKHLMIAVSLVMNFLVNKMFDM